MYANHKPSNSEYIEFWLGINDANVEGRGGQVEIQPESPLTVCKNGPKIVPRIKGSSKPMRAKLQAS